MTLIVTALVVGGILTGMLALSVDVGGIMFERRQLQNGADAVAMSIAKDCGTSTSCNPSLSDAGYTSLANSNAADRSMQITEVCASTALIAKGSPLPLCAAAPAVGSPIAECPAVNSALASAKYVEVKTRTQSATGTLLPPVFAQTLAGSSTYQGTSVQACSRAAFGPPGSGTPIIPVTFSECDWYLGTNNGTAIPSAEVALTFNGANNAACETKYGHPFPGGFGWLNHTSTCLSPTDSNNWVDAYTGIGAANDCASAINATVGKTVLIPVFDCMSKNKIMCDNTAGGTRTFYHIVGYGAFYVTAIDVNGQLKANLAGYPTAAASAQCTAKGGKCIYGMWTKQLVAADASIDPGGLDLGATVVQLAG